MSRTVLAVAAAVALGFGMQAKKAPEWAANARIAPATVGSAPNSSAFGSQVYFAGQPSANDLEQYAKLGVKKVVNLRTPAEMEKAGFDEAAAVKQAGMEYVMVPVSSQPPTEADLQRVYSALQGAGEGKVLMHCASSNRVGLMWSLFRASQHGLGPEEAITEGKAAGMKSPALEKMAREKLGASK
jgi:uncharacterized protein (TIGR01244 family)